MNRFWLGVGILLVLLSVGLGVGRFMSGFHENLTEELTAASAAAAKEDWEEAVSHTESARRHWEKGKKTVAALADHEPLELVDNAFAQLRVYEELLQNQEYAVLCTYLAEMIRSLGESHGLKWWNLL